MGSGSGGGGGGGSGGGGGGGSWGGSGGYRWQDGKIKSDVTPQSRAEREAKKILRKLPKDYLMKQFGSPMIDSIYEELFELSVHVFQNRSWQGVTERYGIAGGGGCLNDWAGTMISRARESEPNQKVRETALLCLDDFLVLALNNDIDLYVSGSSADVLGRLKQSVFKKTSNNFLGAMIWRVLEREKEKLQTSAEVQLRVVAQNIANRCISAFESKFHAKSQITYRDLFRVIQDNPAWFLEELRR